MSGLETSVWVLYIYLYLPLKMLQQSQFEKVNWKEQIIWVFGQDARANMGK